MKIKKFVALYNTRWYNAGEVITAYSDAEIAAYHYEIDYMGVGRSHIQNEIESIVDRFKCEDDSQMSLSEFYMITKLKNLLSEAFGVKERMNSDVNIKLNPNAILPFKRENARSSDMPYPKDIGGEDYDIVTPQSIKRDDNGNPNFLELIPQNVEEIRKEYNRVLEMQADEEQNQFGKHNEWAADLKYAMEIAQNSPTS